MRPRRRPPTAGVVVISMLWAATLAPRIVQSLTAPKFKSSITEQVPYTPIAQLLDRGLGLAFIATCMLVLVNRARNLPTRGRGLALVLVAPWAYLVVRDAFDGRAARIETFVYAFAVLGVWAAAPRLRDLRLLGGLTVATAAFSMVMGALLPAKGLYQASAGELVQADKQIVPWGILVGPVSSGNNLGQLLVMGLPAVLLFDRRSTRLLSWGVTSLAIVWTASRSSLAALAALTAAAVALMVREPSLRRLLSWVALGTLAAVMIGLPLATHSDGDFTNRGYIWRLSLDAWRHSPLFGLGSHWYSEVALLANSIAGAAFHGHNETVQLAVTGGAALLALMAVLLAVVVRSAGQWAARGVGYATAQTAAILVSCTLEVSYGLVDRDLFFPVTVLPLAFILLADPSGRATAPARASHSVTARARAPRPVAVVGGQRASSRRLPHP